MVSLSQAFEEKTCGVGEHLHVVIFKNNFLDFLFASLDVEILPERGLLLKDYRTTFALSVYFYIAKECKKEKPGSG